MKWTSWTNVVLGLWLAVAAFALPHAGGHGVTGDVIAGLLISMAALWAARAFRARVSAAAHLLVLFLGVWTAAAPVVLRYDRWSPSAINDVVVGLGVMALAGWSVWREARRIFG